MEINFLKTWERFSAQQTLAYHSEQRWQSPARELPDQLNGYFYANQSIQSISGANYASVQ